MTDEQLQAVSYWEQHGVPALRGSVEGDQVIDRPEVVPPTDPFFGLALLDHLERLGWDVPLPSRPPAKVYSAYRHKGLFYPFVRIKGAGEPCAQGETSTNTGCIPAVGPAKSPGTTDKDDWKSKAAAIKDKLLKGESLTADELKDFPAVVNKLKTDQVASLYKKVLNKIPTASGGGAAKHEYVQALLDYAKAKQGAASPPAPKPEPPKVDDAGAEPGKDYGSYKPKQSAEGEAEDVLDHYYGNVAKAADSIQAHLDDLKDTGENPDEIEYFQDVYDAIVNWGKPKPPEPAPHPSAGKPCKPGETPEATGCVPAGDAEALDEVEVIDEPVADKYGDYKPTTPADKLAAMMLESGAYSKESLIESVEKTVASHKAAGNEGTAAYWQDVADALKASGGPTPPPAPEPAPVPPSPSPPAADPVQSLIDDYPGVVGKYAGSYGGDKVSVKLPKDHPAVKEILALAGATWSNSFSTANVPASQADAVKAILEKHLEQWPDKPEDLEFVKPLGGHSGGEATLVKDAKGKLWVRKKVVGPQTEQEVAADAAYAIAGLGVPASKIVGGYKLAKYVEGTVLGKMGPSMRALAHEEIRKGFVLDALLGNWDVIGADADNILIDKDGKVYRIDNGGSLEYRAQGAKKTSEQWGDTVPDIDSMRDSSINPQAAKVFKGITNDQIGKQVQELVGKKDALLKALPADQRERVGKRLDWLAKKYMPKKYVSDDGWNYIDVEPWKTTPPDKSVSYSALGTSAEKADPKYKDWVAGMKVYTDDNEKRVGFRASYYDPETLKKSSVPQNVPASVLKHNNAWKKKAGPEGFQAAKSYTNGGYHALNEALKKCPATLDCLGGYHGEWHKNLDAALAQAGVLKEPITVWRYINVDEKSTLEFFQAAAASGDVVKMNGYKSNTTNPGGWHGNVCFEIKARTGVYAEPWSKHKAGPEQEWLQGHGTKYRVLGVKEVPMGGTYGGGKRKVIQLEEVVD